MIRGRIITDDKDTSGIEILEEDFLESFALDFSLMGIPYVTLMLPIKYAKYMTGNSRITLVSNDWRYEGYVGNKVLMLSSGVVKVETSHVVGRLSKRTVPTNITIKSYSVKKTIEHVWGFWKMEGNEDPFVQSFKLNYVDDYAEKNVIEYEFSNETLIEFLDKICNKTQSMYWRVNRYDPYQIDIGIFGRQQDVLITEDTYFISLDDITENYNDVINIGVVMSDKSDGGASSLTLRDIFYNKSLMIQGFPVIKTGRVVNSQRSYDYPQIPQFAPEIIGEEFALMDEEGIALEAGQLYWGTVTTNDIQAIAEDNKELTDDDRINATEQLYYSAIRKLKNSRRKVIYNVTVAPLPNRKVQVGDRVMLNLSVNLSELTACTKYYEKVLKVNDWFYVTEMIDEYSEGASHLQKLSLSKYLYSDRDITATM